MKKKHLILLFVCTLALVGGSSLYTRTSYSRVLEANWGVSLPFKALYQEIYQQNNSGSHGDGIRYHVYRYEYEDYIDLMFGQRVTPFSMAVTLRLPKFGWTSSMFRMRNARPMLTAPTGTKHSPTVVSCWLSGIPALTTCICWSLSYDATKKSFVSAIDTPSLAACSLDHLGQHSFGTEHLSDLPHPASRGL